MHILKTTGMAVMAATLAFSTSQLDAQQLDPDIEERDLSVMVRAGPSMPAADLAEITNDFGTALGAEVGLPLNRRLSVTVDGNVDMFNGATLAAPDMRLWHYGAGLDLETTPRETPWSVVLSGGLNATTMDSDVFDPADADSGDFTQTYLGINTGVQVGYEINESVDLALRGATFFVFADEEETSVLTDLNGTEAFGTAVTVPLTAQVNVAIPNN
jgi:hypothetical protein